MKPNKLEAIIELIGGRISGASDGSEINYHDGQTPPTDEEVDTKLASMLIEWEAQKYARDRKPEYPSVEDQLDMQYHDKIDDTTTHADAVEAVKTKWPKDNSGPVE